MPLATDQRGFARVIDGVADIGAVEMHPFTITIVTGNNQQTDAHTAFATSLTVLVTSAFFEPVWRRRRRRSRRQAAALRRPFPAATRQSPTFSAWLESVQQRATWPAATRWLFRPAGASSTSFSLTNLAAAATQLVIKTQPSATASNRRALQHAARRLH